MLGAAAGDDKRVQMFEPRAEETEQCCCPGNRADVKPGESLTCQVIVALAGSWLVSRMLSCVPGNWCLLHPCPFPVLAS